MLRSSFWFPSCSDKSSKFDSFECSLSAVMIHLRVNGGKNFVHWWMKGIYFVSFYFHICDFILENKHLAKISTCTVFDIKKIILLTVGLGGATQVYNVYTCLTEVYKISLIKICHFEEKILKNRTLACFCSQMLQKPRHTCTPPGKEQ